MADDPERDIYPSKEIKNPSVTSEVHGKSFYFYFFLNIFLGHHKSPSFVPNST